MTDEGQRYDRIAAGYDRWWAPVLAPAALALLDRVEPVVAGGARRVLDLGAGAGMLTLGAVGRWASVEVTAVDASAGMLGLLESKLAERASDERARVRMVTAFADRLPLEAGSIDLAVSSFVLQLVPSRAAALRELRRVIRPGGRVAYVTWLAGGTAYPGDDVFESVLDELGLEGREPPDPRAGDLLSVAAAADGLRRAGFRRARAEPGQVEHVFTPEGYVAFLEHFDEEDRFAELEPAVRDELRSRLLDRLRALHPADLVLRLPTVYATAVVPE